VGHGLSRARDEGGLGNISKVIISLAPCLKEVPIQSVAVSPPPTTNTFLPFANAFKSSKFFLISPCCSCQPYIGYNF